MTQDRQLLIDHFNQKGFQDKKVFLLEILSKLYGTAQIITDLGNLVHNLRDETKGGMLSEVYDILLDAVDAIKDDEMSASVASLEKARDMLVEMRRREQEEREAERNGLDIENMFA